MQSTSEGDTDRAKDVSTNTRDDNDSMKNTTKNTENRPNTGNVTTDDVDLDNNFDPNAPCGVCWNATPHDDDALIYCVGCNVPIHKSCYAISERMYNAICSTLFHIRNALVRLTVSLTK